MGSIRAEAVTIRRTLAGANPAAYLPDLATSLNNLADRLVESGRTEDAAAAWDAPVRAMPDQVSRAELRAHAASWLADHDQPGPAREHLTLAAEDADDATGVPHLLARARRTIRRVAQTTVADDPEFPPWATAALPDPDVELADTWAADGWPHREHLAREHATVFTSPPLRRTVGVLSALSPDHPALADLTALLADIDEHGLEVALRERRQHHDRLTLVQD